MTMFSSQWFGGSSSIEGSNTDNTRSSTDATTFTFSDQDIGGAATNRVIAVAVGMGANTALRDIDSVTVGGTNLSKQVGSEVINAGVENFRIQDLRACAITNFFLPPYNFNIPMVAKISGHKSYKELYRYERMKPADIVDQFIKLKK